MYNTYLTSRISLSSSTRAAHPFHDYPSFSPPSCCCYCSCYTSTMMYKTPTTPSYCYNLYGLRQSSLIQCRKLISGGYYTRLPVSNVDRSCTCDRICAFRGKSAGGGRKVGSRKCMMSFEDRSESCDFDEAEVLLSLLSEGIGEEKSFRVGKETKRWIKKEPVMEKRESGGGSEKKCGGKKKRIVIDITESEPSCECEYELVGFGSRIKDNRRGERFRRRDEGKGGEEMVDVSDGEPSCEYESLVSALRNKDNRRGEGIRRKEEMEALSREENRNAVLREENKESLLSNQAKREREERVLLLRKARLKDEEKQEGEFMSRKENSKVMAKKEDREDLSRREEHRNRMRKDGSSCSSYYSVSSTGDYGSDDEIELGEGRYREESSSGYKRNSRNSEEDQRYEGHREDHCVSLINKSNAKESSVVESDFRKKSEKKLADVSVEEIEPRKETMGNHSKFLMDHDSKYHGKSYDYYVGYDDRKVKSNESMEVEERRERNRQTGDDSRQHKQFVEMQDNRSHPRNSPKVASPSQETVGERRTAVGLGRDDEYNRRNSHRVAEVSEIQEIDRRKTYISQQDIDITKTEISREEIETNIMKQHNRSDDVSYSYGSRRVNSDKNDVPAEVASVSHETVGAHKAAVGYGSRDDDYYRRNSDKMAAVSEIQEIDLRKTSVSQQETDFRKTSVSQQETDFRKTSVSQQGTGTRFEKKKDNSTNILSSINDDARNQQSRGKSQQLAIKEGTSVSKRKLDDKRVKQEQNVDLAYGSSLESKEQHSQTYAKRTDSSRNESNELTKTTISRPGDFVAVDIEDRNKTKSNILLRLPSSALPVESNSGSISNKVSYGGLQFGSTAHNLEESQEQPTKFLSHEDAIGSAARQEKFSARYVDSFVDKVKNEILSSEIQGEKKTNETKNVGEEQQGQTSSAQTSSGDSKSRHSTTKGPSDEMWDVDEPSVKPEVQDDDASRGVIVKRSGRSIWNVIADIVHLRWSARSEGHSSGRRTGGRSSPIQSMSSETWFSGHEAEEHVEVARDKEEGNTTQGGRQEEKTRLQAEEGSSLSRAEGRLKPVGSNAPSSSSAAIVDSSTSSPAHKLHRSPVVKRDSEGGEARISASGTSEQLNTGSIDQPESSVSKGELKQRKLGRKDQIVSERFEEWEEAYRLEAEHLKIDEMFMREALVEAKKAADNWEVPVGAVLVQNGKIIARGCNLVEELRDSTAHAEMICIREASNALRTWRLSDTTLYVTLEPCPMCAGAILQARIDTVVWGAPNKLLGADGSWIRLFPSGDGNELEQSDKPPAPIHPFHPKIVIRRRVLASECADAMQQFFQLRRKKKDNQPDPPGTSPSCLPISHHHPSKFLTKMHNAFHLMFCL